MLRGQMVNKLGPKADRVPEEEGEATGLEFNVVLCIV